MVGAAAVLRGKPSAGVVDNVFTGCDPLRLRWQRAGLRGIGDLQGDGVERLHDEEVGRPDGVGGSEPGVREQLAETSWSTSPSSLSTSALMTTASSGK
jgi:hypothetical protein